MTRRTGQSARRVPARLHPRLEAGEPRAPGDESRVPEATNHLRAPLGDVAPLRGFGDRKAVEFIQSTDCAEKVECSQCHQTKGNDGYLPFYAVQLLSRLLQQTVGTFSPVMVV